MKTYAFNLLPQKAKSLVKKEEKRDTYSVMLAFLPLLSVVIWLVLILLNGVILAEQKRSWLNSINNSQDRIENEFKPVLLEHGELVTKTRTLGQVILKDIAPEELFLLVNELFPENDTSFKIIGYGRNEDGSFTLSVKGYSYLKISQITRRLANYEKVQNVRINSVSQNIATTSVIADISFLFKTEE